MRQAGIQAEGEIGSSRSSPRPAWRPSRQALAAIFWVAGERGPAALAELSIGVLEARGRAHHAIFEAAAFLDRRWRLREQHAPRPEFRRLFEHGVDEIGRELLVARQRRRRRRNSCRRKRMSRRGAVVGLIMSSLSCATVCRSSACVSMRASVPALRISAHEAGRSSARISCSVTSSMMSASPPESTLASSPATTISYGVATPFSPEILGGHAHGHAPRGAGQA